ncbi:MAG: hypothetical protein E7Z63_01025 [Thermoplasmata archaeon]|nr:hypothetical protein [Thermoplasmata archaeon]
MGWDGIPCHRFSEWSTADKKEFIRNEVGFPCLRDTIRGNVYYGVYDNGREVFALVTLIQTDPDMVYLKHMSEDMGPYYYDMPVSYLDLLSPPANDYSREWREKVRAKASVPKVKFDDRRYSVGGGPDMGYNEMMGSLGLGAYADGYRRKKLIREQKVGGRLRINGWEVTRTKNTKGKRRGL